jgi:hypothetical protein
MDSKILTRFWSKVNKDTDSGCWEWTSTLRLGYGRFHYMQVDGASHRFSWIIHNGDIPKGDHHGTLCVLHKCDNRKCVHPDHLFLGTQQDNMTDKVSKSRQYIPAGTKHYRARLTEDKVREMRMWYDLGYSSARMAILYCVSHGHASNICKRIRWSHVV